MNPYNDIQECNCAAYPFPHPAGYVECHVEDTNAPVCDSCGRNCTSKKCDDGIGPYEYWGQRGVDSRPYIGSDCCEADIIEPTTLRNYKTNGEPLPLNMLFLILAEVVRKDMPDDYFDLLWAFCIPAAAYRNIAHPYWSSTDFGTFYAAVLNLLDGYDLETLINGAHL